MLGYADLPVYEEMSRLSLDSTEKVGSVSETLVGAFPVSARVLGVRKREEALRSSGLPVSP